MAYRLRSSLLVLSLPLLAGLGATSLLDFPQEAARAAEGSALEAARESGDAVARLDAQRLLVDSAAPLPRDPALPLFDPALPPWSLSAEALASGQRHRAAPQPPLPIPEPASGLLLGLGLAGLAARRRAAPRA